MVGFKKDQDKPSIKQEIFSSLAIFLSGFIIATFLVLYIVLAVVTEMKRESNNNGGEEPSPVEPIDIYKDERSIINNLLDISKDFNDSINNISNISYDSSYMYLVCNDDSKLYILSIDKEDKDVNLILESLITSKGDIEIDSLISQYDITELPSVKVRNESSFKDDNRFKGYTYIEDNYYINDLKNEVGISMIGYKPNHTYVSLLSYTYIIDTHTMSDNPGMKVVTDNMNDEYYKLLDYLYHL